MITAKKRLSIVLTGLFVVLFFGGCEEADPLNSDQPVTTLEDGKQIIKADESTLSDEEQDRYQKMAEKLAIRYINEKNPEATEIPGDAVAFFYHGLIHLNNSDLEEANIVTDEYTMVVNSPAHPREVLLWTVVSEPWLDSWRNGDTQTGVPEIDQLIEQFDLTLNRYREFTNIGNKVVAEMRSNRPINVYAVGKLFSDTEEIVNAGPDGLLTGGRDIKATVNDDFLLLDVTVGSGDCPSGCINRINHQFRIFSDGQVELDK